MKFALNITLGNDAMRTHRDVAEALTAVSSSLEKWEAMPLDDPSAEGLRGKILDFNGNTVGEWEVTS